MKKRSNLFDYLQWRGDLSLKAVPFCEVDALILSMLAYLHLDKVSEGRITSFSAAMKKYRDLPEEARYLGALIPEPTTPLAYAVAESGRFSESSFSDFSDHLDEKRQMQFAAVTFHLPDDSLYISFRGTDDTIVGWKEDLNLSFSAPVPSQLEAAGYLNRIGKKFPNRPIRLGGHSKGGNLAHFAAIFCNAEIQERILSAYSNDGPGFESSLLAKKEYQRIEGRLHTFVPQSSLVGMLLTHDEGYQVIHSTETGFLQHDAFSWEIQQGHFVYLDQRSAFGEKTADAVRGWIASLSHEERRHISETIFQAAMDTNTKTLTQLNASRLEAAKRILTILGKCDKPTKKMLWDLLRRMISPTKSKK